MLYAILTETYEKLEATTKKLEKRDIISDLLKKTESKDLEKTVLLLTGRVFPVWSEAETGVATQLMIKALTKSSGIKEKQIIKIFKEIGDLGLAAEKSIKEKTQTTFKTEKLTLEKVFETIKRIASETGKGSQERKLNLIANLLASAKPKEAKYIVRTVLEELRIGVAEGIIRDSIAKAYDVSAEAVENAWFLNPDYGEIAKIAKEKGEAGLKEVKIELGKPIMLLLAEKSPSLEKALKTYENPGFEIKYDGARIIIQKKGEKIWLFTRRLEDVTKNFPDIVKLAKKSLKAEKCIVDGECLAIDKTGKPLPFQALSQRIQRKYDIEKMVKEVPIQMNLFDILYLEEESLFEKPFRERRRLLEKVVVPIKGKFQLAEHLRTKDLKEAEKFYKKALDMGEEGVIVKNLDAKYQPGRKVGYWLKVKPVMENLDLVIIGAEYGTGKRTGWFGSFVLGCRDPDSGKYLECGMMGTGIKEKKTEDTDVTFKDLTKMLKPLVEKEEGKRVWIKPKIVIEVAYEEIQKSPNYESGWALRFPRFVRIRTEEKPAEQADTLERIKKLYKMQKGKK